jgi:hypothetical protein
MLLYFSLLHRFTWMEKGIACLKIAFLFSLVQCRPRHSKVEDTQSSVVSGSKWCFVTLHSNLTASIWQLSMFFLCVVPNNSPHF